MTLKEHNLKTSIELIECILKEHENDTEAIQQKIRKGEKFLGGWHKKELAINDAVVRVLEQILDEQLKPQEKELQNLKLPIECAYEKRTNEVCKHPDCCFKRGNNQALKKILGA